VEIWFLSEGRRKVFDQPRALWLWAVSPDGRWLATSAFDGALRLWDVEGGTLVETFPGQFGRYDGVTFTPDSSRLVAGGGDGTITIWDLTTRQQVAHWKAHERGCVWLRFVGGDESLVSLGDCKDFERWQGDLRLWRAPSLSRIGIAKMNP
jgi:WD40 repeat protein